VAIERLLGVKKISDQSSLGDWLRAIGDPGRDPLRQIRREFVTCDDRAGEAQRAFERHRLKGDWERRLSELLSDFQLHHLPCRRLVANQCFYALATLTLMILGKITLVVCETLH